MTCSVACTFHGWAYFGHSKLHPNPFKHRLNMADQILQGLSFMFLKKGLFGINPKAISQLEENGTHMLLFFPMLAFAIIHPP
jgi:hypothetical protein